MVIFVISIVVITFLVLDSAVKIVTLCKN